MLLCYNAAMKRCSALFLILFLLFSSAACGTGAPAGVPVDVGTSPAPSDSAPGDSATPTASEKGPSARVDATAALLYDGAEGLTLYGAASYTNTGDCPIIIETAAFAFSVGGQTIEHSFAPPLGEYTILLPGETSYLTAWVPQDAQSGLVAGTEATLAVSLTPRKAEATRTLLTLDHLYLADNYPNFTTLSGRMTCLGALGCEMNIVHVGFYGPEEEFLGAWYFTKNTLFEGDESKDFVVQMHGLPLDSLATRAEQVQAIGFGFML